MKTALNPTLAQVSVDLAAGELLKKTPIALGFVRFERHDYHYGRQGQVTLSHYTCKDLPEYEAINWINYGSSSVTWPDGAAEFFDTRVTPCRHGGQGYGTITRTDGKVASGTLSRLPNVFVEYYGPRLVTNDERATFKLHDFNL